MTPRVSLIRFAAIAVLSLSFAHATEPAQPNLLDALGKLFQTKTEAPPAAGPDAPGRAKRSLSWR
jgi:hypothetical protein